MVTRAAGMSEKDSEAIRTRGSAKGVAWTSCPEGGVRDRGWCPLFGDSLFRWIPRALGRKDGRRKLMGPASSASFVKCARKERGPSLEQMEEGESSGAGKCIRRREPLRGERALWIEAWGPSSRVSGSKVKRLERWGIEGESLRRGQPKSSPIVSWREQSCRVTFTA